MALLPIIDAPDPRLKLKSRPIETVNDDLRRLLDDMLETMYAAPGIGLSAIQVGIPRQAIVIDVQREDEPRKPLYLINPEIVRLSEETAVFNEGCLSLPDQFCEIERPAAVTVRHLDRDGKRRELTADGLLSRCIQHEMDHLHGVLFVDHLSAVKRNMILRKLVKARRQKASA
jgi:peptide deformylase